MRICWSLSGKLRKDLKSPERQAPAERDVRESFCPSATNVSSNQSRARLGGSV
jgi:hypothetical protein